MFLTPVSMRSRRARLAGGWAAVLTASSLAGAELPSFDFRHATDTLGWTATHHVGPLQPTAEGLRVTITGHDPYLHGPPMALPEGQPLWLRLQLRSDQGGMGQVFYFRDRPTEEHSIRFPVPAGDWHEVRLRLPPLGPGHRLRLDPPGDAGECRIAALQIEVRTVFTEPAWPVPTVPDLGAEPVRLRSGDLELLHAGTALDAFEVQVAGQRLAVGQNRSLLGYAIGDTVRWIPFGHGPDTVLRHRLIPSPPADAPSAASGPHSLQLEARFSDPDGGRWLVTRTFTPAGEGTLAVRMTVQTDVGREILYLPWLTLLPGLGDFGTNKVQGLFAGLEYLENEPSSSTADLNPPASNRQVPDRIKLTFPLMAIAHHDRYIGLTWEPLPDALLAACFDSPDRFFHSGAHLMGLLSPGSDGVLRDESRLIPYEPMRLAPGQPLHLEAAILGGRGRSVVPAIQHYVRLRGLPPVPPAPWSRNDYYTLVARSWLDSKVRENNRYRHAVWPGFGATPATDAAFQMRWLAGRLEDPVLADRLHQAAHDALAGLPPATLNDRQIGHVRYPAPALLMKSATAAAQHAAQTARHLLGRFEADGFVRYRPPAAGPDYGRTHWAPDANGLTAQVVASLLEAAVFAGDPGQIEAGLRHLRALTVRHAGSVPRGAQTWEIPLHTPDILASAHLVRACTLGYELTGDGTWLDEARYWAWTGVPFVYLTPPTSSPVGLYNTIAVLGATTWVAPIWLGQPVQWCGLVYAHALDALARHDPDGPWRQLADGIAVGGMQHTWPAEDPDRLGLLADYFLLRAQRIEGPAINPATVFLPALRLLREPRLYEFRALRRSGILLHVPGEVSGLVDTPERVAFKVEGWWPEPYEILVTGLQQTPAVHLDGQPASDPVAAHDLATGRLVLRVSGSPRIELHW